MIRCSQMHKHNHYLLAIL